MVKRARVDATPVAFGPSDPSLAVPTAPPPAAGSQHQEADEEQARKAAKAQRKAHRKEAKLAALLIEAPTAQAPGPPGETAQDERPAKKAKKAKKRAKHDSHEESSTSHTTALDPSLAGLLRDDAHPPQAQSGSYAGATAEGGQSGGNHSQFPLGDIPVDPALLHVRPAMGNTSGPHHEVGSLPAPAPTPAPAPAPAPVLAPTQAPFLPSGSPPTGTDGGALLASDHGDQYQEESDAKKPRKGKEKDKAKKKKSKNKDKHKATEPVSSVTAPSMLPIPPAEPTAGSSEPSPAAPSAAEPSTGEEKKRKGRLAKAPPAANPVVDASTSVSVRTSVAGPAAPVPGSRAAHFYEDLVTKWMSSKQLKEAAEEAGATYSVGRFTSTEDATIDNIVSAFCYERSYSTDDFRAWLVVKRSATDKAAQKADTHDLWERLGRALRTRPLLAIYNHVKARYPAPDAASAKGDKWTQEDDDRLRQAVREMGNSWERIGTAVGRHATSCRDRWTKQLGEGKVDIKKGPWTLEEEEQLRVLVGEWGAQWKIISAKMGHARTATQCRTKWNDYLKRRDAAAADPETGKPRFHWRGEDSSRLVHLVASYSPLPPTLSDLPWSTLAQQDEQLAPHGTKNLRDRFRTLARYAVKSLGAERGLAPDAEVPLADILAVLITQHPSPSSRPLRRPRVPSAAPRALREAGKDEAQRGGSNAAGVDGGGAASGPGGARGASKKARGKGAAGVYKSKEVVDTDDEDEEDQDSDHEEHGDDGADDDEDDDDDDEGKDGGGDGRAGEGGQEDISTTTEDEDE